MDDIKLGPALDPEQSAIFLSSGEISLAASEEGAEDNPRTSEIQLMRGGTYDHPWNGMLLFDRDLFNQLQVNFKNNATGRRLAMDTDHTAARGDSTAYGWFTDIRAQIDGTEDTDVSLWATVEWTEPGVRAIENNLFKYTSVEMAFNYKDERGKFHGPAVQGAALTNRPFLTGMDEVTLNLSQHADYFATTTVEPPVKDEDTTTPKKGAIMNLMEKIIAALKTTDIVEDEITNDEVEETFLSRLREELNLSEDEVKDVELVEAVNKVFAAADVLVEDEPEAVPADQPDVVDKPAEEITLDTSTIDPEITKLINAQATEIESLTAKRTEDVARLDTLVAERDEMKAETLLEEARRSGKLSASMEDAWAGKLVRENPEQFAAVLATLPVIPGLGEPHGTERGNSETATVGAETTFDAAVKEIQKSEDVDYAAAYSKVRDTQPQLYRKYKDEAGLGVNVRRAQATKAIKAVEDLVNG